MRYIARPVLSAFATIVVGLALSSGAGAQQQTRMPVIGFLGAAWASDYPGPLEAFHEGLKDQGYVEGKNVAITYRWALGDTEKLPALAAELVRIGVDVIVASGGLSPALAAQAATQKIPIVSTGAGGSLAASFAQPGGNVTGAQSQSTGLNPKRLELLHQAVPDAILAAVLFNPVTIESPETLNELREAARSLGVRLYMAEARSEGDLDNAFALIAQAGAGAVLVIGGPSFLTQREKIVALAARYKSPAIYNWREFAADGGLMAYGDSLSTLYRRAGDYAGRILKGAEPGDLPIDRPAVIQLVINLQTAKALGLTLPPAILGRADEVIE